MTQGRLVKIMVFFGYRSVENFARNKVKTLPVNAGHFYTTAVPPVGGYHLREFGYET